MLRTAVVCGLAGLLSLTGCATFDPPDGYVKLHDPGPYDVKAVSARGNVIALTDRPNEGDGADLRFWAEAIEYQKVDVDGMKLAGREPIQTKNKLDGVLFQFEIGEGEGKCAYLVALYVTPRRIVTVEATGPADGIAEDLEKLRASMASVR